MPEIGSGGDEFQKVLLIYVMIHDTVLDKTEESKLLYLAF